MRTQMDQPTTVEELEQVLWDIFKITGGDTDGLEEPPRGTSTPVEQVALQAVAELRDDYQALLLVTD